MNHLTGSIIQSYLETFLQELDQNEEIQTLNGDGKRFGVDLRTSINVYERSV